MRPDSNLHDVQRQNLQALKARYLEKVARLSTAHAYEAAEALRIQLEHQIRQAESDLARVDRQLAELASRAVTDSRSADPAQSTPSSTPPWPKLIRQPDRLRLHGFVRQVLQLDSELVEFCLASYPRVWSEFASGQTHGDRMLLLLARADNTDELLANLVRFKPERCLQLRQLLTEEP